MNPMLDGRNMPRTWENSSKSAKVGMSVYNSKSTAIQQYYQTTNVFPEQFMMKNCISQIQSNLMKTLPHKDTKHTHSSIQCLQLFLSYRRRLHAVASLVLHRIVSTCTSQQIIIYNFIIKLICTIKRIVNCRHDKMILINLNDAKLSSSSFMAGNECSISL